MESTMTNMKNQLLSNRQLINYGFVGLVGVIVNSLVLLFLTNIGLSVFLSSLVATEFAVISNFLGNNSLTFKDKKTASSSLEKFLSFQAISLFTILATASLLWGLTELLNISSDGLLLVMNIFVIGLVFMSNYLLNTKYTWGKTLSKRVSLVIIISFIFLILLQSSLAVSDSQLTQPNSGSGNGFDDLIGDFNNLDPSHDPNVFSEETNQSNSTNSSGGSGNSTNSTNTNSTMFNATLLLNYEPANATVEINGSDISNNGSINISLYPGDYLLTIEAESYDDYMLDLTLSAEEIFELMVALNETFINNTGNNSGNSTDNSTNSTNSTDGDTGGDDNSTNSTGGGNAGNETNSSIYVSSSSSIIDSILLEESTAVFLITLSRDDSVTWKVDGAVMDQTQGDEHSFSWTPDIFFTSNEQEITVSGEFNGTSVSWTFTVVNLLNPFFSDGTAENNVLVRVYTYNEYTDLTSMVVTLENDGSETNHSLESSVGGAETEWKNIVPVNYGTTRLKAIIVHSNTSNTTTSYYFDGTERSYYRESPASNSGSDDDSDESSGRTGGGGGSGGGGGGAPPGVVTGNTDPEIVYVTYGKDIVALGDSQTVTLDARASAGKTIEGISGRFRDAQGAIHTVRFSLETGSHYYGTWSSSIDSCSLGKCALQSLTITESDGTESTHSVSSSFYVAGDVEEAYLTVVYSVLNSSEVENGSTVLLTLDAKDSVGITRVSATVDSNRGDSQTFDLKLVGGDKFYGTWEGEFIVMNADATYEVSAVTLSNGVDEETIPVSKRQVYVKAIPYVPSLITGNVVAEPITLEEILKEPFLPVTLAFLLVGVIVGITFGARKIRERNQLRG